MYPAKTNRQEIIIKAIKLFEVKGFHNTSMEDIAQACGVKKASLYNHIKSKEALLVAAVKAKSLQFTTLLKSSLSQDVSKDVLHEELTRFVKDYFIEQRSQCLISKLIYEMANRADFYPHANEYFRSWVTILAERLTQADSRLQALEQAEDMVAQLQGALILGRTQTCTKIFDRAVAKMVASITQS